MGDEIVRRLLSRKFNPIRESLPYTKQSLLEKDEDEEDVLDTEPTEEEEDESPEVEEETPEDDTSIEKVPHLAAPSTRRSIGARKSDIPDGEEETEAPKKKEVKKSKNNVNPLDNPYAVNHKIGDPVALTYTNGNLTELEAKIEGYDKEGFYRIKLDNGFTINGLTDIALSSLIANPQKESTCVCGSDHFINEGGYVICDDCGRRIRESGLDNLTVLDKQRPKGKKLIRSIPHDMTTATKPNISGAGADADAAVGESIKKAFKKNSKLQEDYDEDENPYLKLRAELDNEFWTRLPEMQESIEDLGYEIGEINNEYVTVTADGFDTEYYIPVGGTPRTITLDFSRAKMI